MNGIEATAQIKKHWPETRQTYLLYLCADGH
jgi:hypothetical protein